MMTLYLVDRDTPGVTMDQLVAAQRSMIAVSQRFTARGEYVRYIRSTYLPDESRCMCWFEAPSAEAVAEVHEVAKVPFDRIIEAIEFTPEA